jgi:hypothetical protein
MMLLPMLLTLSAPSPTIEPNHALRFGHETDALIVPYRKIMDVKELTLEAWIYVEPEASENFFNYIVCRNYADLGYGMALHGRSPKVWSQAKAPPIAIGKWTHLAAVVTKSVLKCYIDGEYVYSEPRNDYLKPFQHDLIIGNSDMTGEPGGTRTCFRGRIDEVRIWSRPRTQAQIRATMNRFLRGNERGLIAYYPFEEQMGQSIRDVSGHLSPGVLSTMDADPWSEGPQLEGKVPRLR